MNGPNSLFRQAWITAGQGDLWNCTGTYCLVPQANLPRLERATDDLQWLDDISPDLRQVISGTSTLKSGENQIGHLEVMVARARQLGLNLPEPFLRFMRNPGLQAKVPTCTDCHLDLANDFVPLKEGDGHFLLRFLNDSQSCWLWYLFLDRGGKAGVVASPYFLEPEIFKVMEYEDVTREDCFQEACFCADTFTEFLYRFWVENSIWFSSYKRLKLTPIQEQYRSQIIQKL